MKRTLLVIIIGIVVAINILSFAVTVYDKYFKDEKVEEVDTEPKVKIIYVE